MFQDTLKWVQLGAKPMYTPLSVNESTHGYVYFYTSTGDVKCVLCCSMHVSDAPDTFLSAGLEGENILFKELLHNFKELLLAPQGFETAKSKLLKVTC